MAVSASIHDDLEEAPGAWPESVDIQYFADSSMTLPGEGKSGKNCGDWSPTRFCESCGTVHFGPSRCGQRACPSCGTTWARERAEAITARLGAARQAAENGSQRRAVHTVASPPTGEIRTLRDVYAGFREAYELARRQGVRGGVAVFHGFRVTSEAKRTFAEAVEAGEWTPDEDGGLWRWVKCESADWRSLTYWSPHYHIIGLGAEIAENQPDEQGGWVFHRIRSLSPFYLNQSDGYTDMATLAMYLLSHATFETNSSRDCIRWFGELSTASFSPADELAAGVLERVEEMAEKALQSGVNGGSDPESDSCRECGSLAFSPIWDANMALRDSEWCSSISRRKVKELKAAFEWVIGDRPPPAGLKRPRSEAEAMEALDALV